MRGSRSHREQNQGSVLSAWGHARGSSKHLSSGTLFRSHEGPPFYGTAAMATETRGRKREETNKREQDLSAVVVAV